jgi:nitrate reductase / nitrite oxidoreductase, beta subunit
MNVRAQMSMVFHLDKCLGCHTCSVACKNIWTDRKGAEYMWWNNVETKPGTGFPTQWEDQSKYMGGWEQRNGSLKLKSTSKFKGLSNIFFQPYLPTMDDYYEPFTYKYGDLFNAPAGDDQPTARAISQVTGDYMNIEAGPNWDDDLSGSDIYAKNDPNKDAITEAERQSFLEIEKIVSLYIPRICNHCTNPACVASCPSGAIYKRGEDGIVLIDQNVCRGWRYCVSACPYKKVYYNWNTGKSEKCILCYPRLETDQANACFHSCTGRIRYLGVVLYDADRIEEIANSPEEELVTKQRELILDPNDPEVIAQAKKDGIAMGVIESAQKSPVYKFVKEWGIALPLHPEYRTLPMLFYVPPMLPVVGRSENKVIDVDSDSFFGTIEKARLPIKYIANMFSAGNTEVINDVYQKLLAVRAYRRAEGPENPDADKIPDILKAADLTRETAEGIFKLTATPTYNERFVIPPSHREEAIEMLKDTDEHKADTGFGFIKEPRRGL